MLPPVATYLALYAIDKAVPVWLILEWLGKHYEVDKDYMKHLHNFLLESVVLHNKAALQKLNGA